MSNDTQRSFSDWLDGNMERGMFSAPPAFYTEYHENCGSLYADDATIPLKTEGVN